MWIKKSTYQKLCSDIEALKAKIAEIESPYQFDIGDKVTGGVAIKGIVVGRTKNLVQWRFYNENSSYRYDLIYDVYVESKKKIIKFSESDLSLTK